MIVKCSHCHKLFSKTDFNSHKCDIPINDCKKIEVVYFQEGSYGSKQRMLGMGTDGILYTFEVIPRKAIPIMEPLSNRKVTTHYDEEENNQRGNST